MTKIMAVTLVPVLMVLGFLTPQVTPRPSQDAKSVAIDATRPVKNNESAQDLQRRRTLVMMQASRARVRDNIEWRRERAEARAEARAARKAARQEARAERVAEAEAATRAGTRTTSSSGSGDLPELLLFIRSNESGGNYSAYNGSGCEGYGCGGAYQLHAKYASSWAASAGYPGLSSNAANWPASTQDAVAKWLFYSTNPDGAHWCNWTDYC